MSYKVQYTDPLKSVVDKRSPLIRTIVFSRRCFCRETTVSYSRRPSPLARHRRKLCFTVYIAVKRIPLAHLGTSQRWILSKAQATKVQTNFITSIQYKPLVSRFATDSAKVLAVCLPATAGRGARMPLLITRQKRKMFSLSTGWVNENIPPKHEDNAWYNENKFL